jgi:hypothetical protein
LELWHGRWILLLLYTGQQLASFKILLTESREYVERAFEQNQMKPKGESTAQRNQGNAEEGGPYQIMGREGHSFSRLLEPVEAVEVPAGQ